MESDSILKHVAIAFVIALALYFGAYSWIEHRRHVKGPWEVTFVADERGTPAIIVEQPALNISNLRIEFPGQTVDPQGLPQTISFEKPLPHLPHAMPFGEVIFFDTTSLPGTVTFNFFEHEIELLPRVLFVNKKEHPWREGGVEVRGER